MKNSIALLAILFTAFIYNQTHAQAGALDTSFGGTGKVATALSSSGHSYGTASAIQSDGKIIAAGYAYFGNDVDFAVSRYNTDGSLDLTFDGDGMVTTDIGDINDFCYSVAIQSDGKIVVTGNTANFTQVAVVRYNSDGSLDSTFDFDGIKIISLAADFAQGYSVAIQGDGKILIAAQSFVTVNVDFLVIRLNENGNLDSTFGTDGLALVDISGDDLVYAMALQTDGKIVVAGTSSMDFAAIRLNTDGSLDTSFDTDGKVKTPVTIGEDIATALTLQNDGKIILAGVTNAPGNLNLLVRYNTDGSLDTSFDSDGMVITSNTCTVYGVKVQTNGKIVAVGTYPVSASLDFVVIRYNADGTLDLTFDNDGVVTTDLGFGTDDIAYATSIQANGKVVVVGHGNNAGYNNFMVVRYHPDNSNSLENLTESAFSFYPNPTSGILNIQHQENAFSIKITNNIGQQVYTENCTTNKSFIDIHHLPTGIYFLTLQSDSQSFTSRFVKE
jgi:uncharacterized delta-60 repeat protein